MCLSEYLHHKLSEVVFTIRSEVAFSFDSSKAMEQHVFRAGPDVRIQRLDGLMHNFVGIGFLFDSSGLEGDMIAAQKKNEKHGVRACLMCLWGAATPIAVEAFFEKHIQCGHVLLKCGT